MTGGIKGLVEFLEKGRKIGLLELPLISLLFNVTHGLSRRSTD
jgi:hypothetical protein